MPITNFPNGFPNGLSIRGVPLVQAQPGQAFWLCNSPVLKPLQRSSSDSNRGTYMDPFSTLEYAMSACRPGRGDIVFVGAGHAETISSAAIASLKTSGVAVIGMGTGNIRPTFTFTTATTANIPVAGSDISIQNCLFIANFAAVASYFTAVVASFTGVVANGVLTASSVTGTIYPGVRLNGTGVTVGTVLVNQITGTTGGAGTYNVLGSTTVASTAMTTLVRNFSIDNCEFRDTTSSLNALQVFTTPATDNACDGISLTNSKVFGLGTTATTAPFEIAGNLDRLTVQNNYIVNMLAANGILIYLPTTTKVLTRVLIDENTIVTTAVDAATGLLILTTATTNTGVISRNRVNGLRAIASAILATASSGFHFYDNRYHLTADVSGVILPAAQT